MVVDGLEGHAGRRLTADEPFGATVVDLALQMAILDRLLDIARIKSALSEAVLRVFGPDEAPNLHGRSLWLRRQIGDTAQFRIATHSATRGLMHRREDLVRCPKQSAGHE